MWKTFAIAAVFFAAGNAKDCVPYFDGTDIVACICNATYCDDTPNNDPKIPEKGTSYWYVTNKEGLRMKMLKAEFNTYHESSPDETLIVDTKKRYQTIFGFGAAFTDSAGINIKSLSRATQEQLIRACYDPESGSRYTLGRIPIASTDFSTRGYTYDDYANDTSLEHFALAPEDYDYKIPYARMALELNPEVRFVGAAWSAPPWMKTVNKLDGGFLKNEYYQLWANYLLKFLDEYKKNGIDMWAITTGNEPLNAIEPIFPLTTMGWTPESMADWVSKFLGPTLASSIHNGTLILALDDNRHVLPRFVEPILSEKNGSKYTAGTAVHFYKDSIAPATVLDAIHDLFPDKVLLMTEASVAPVSWRTPNAVPDTWNRGESYALSIIEYMNHWSIGWLDWNLALNEAGGPSWLNNSNDAAIIVNSDRDEFYKLPLYYAIKHFSRFVDRGSVRVSITDTDSIKSTAFTTTLEEVVVVLCNRNNSSKSVILKDLYRGTLRLELSPHSMNTVIYQ
ncbi:lysosomal acid glucosylceramidase-like [Colletes gigas]|uniref:lysosomal acid glucosylceramidase-like n=1 Tax=Colletes gigas TaxID=935657 RepID=UPI001C9BB652|nr:lysosomal acid glucosylceramidase-like [Colletes gigas]